MSEVRTPPAVSRISNGTEIDWAMAHKAALAIVKQCEDAGFTPPEATDIHQMRIGCVCVALDAIVDALRIRRAAP